MLVVLDVFLLEKAVLSAISKRFNAPYIVLGVLGILFDANLKHNVGAGLFSKPCSIIT